MALVSLSFRPMLLLHGPIDAVFSIDFEAYFAGSIWIATLGNLMLVEAILRSGRRAS
jgi:hypothetical protein